jgi:hypothetical protein
MLSKTFRKAIFKKRDDRWQNTGDHCITYSTKLQIFSVVIITELFLKDIQRIIHNEEQKPIGITPEMLWLTIIKKRKFSKYAAPSGRRKTIS